MKPGLDQNFSPGRFFQKGFAYSLLTDGTVSYGDTPRIALVLEVVSVSTVRNFGDSYEKCIVLSDTGDVRTIWLKQSARRKL